MSRLRRAAWATGAPARSLLVVLIRVYRVGLAGLLGGQCRFHPSCSHYAESAIRTHGALRGAMLACWRVLRCNPFGTGGPDPVPSRRAAALGLYDGITRPREGPA